METVGFTYDEFTTRNFGFVNHDEQKTLQEASVFICGVGGMGGACIQALARSGIGNFIIADMDVFEVSAILDRVDIVVNGMDDVAETVKLYRKCREKKLTIIDAYAASLPSVYVTRPGEPTPEERLDYPTQGRAPKDWTDADMNAAFVCELEYVMGCSSSRKYIDMEAGAEMAAGKRSRMSFAPMVILTGNLMAYEAVNALLGKTSGADHRGYFFNPHTGKTERAPLKPIEWVLRKIAGRLIAKLMS